MSKWAVWKSPATNYVGWVKGCSAQEEGYQYSFSDLCEYDPKHPRREGLISNCNYR